MRKTKKKKNHSDKSILAIIKDIRTQGMLLNVDDYVINTKDELDLLYMKKMMTKSVNIRDRVEYLYDSFKAEFKINVWENCQKWGEIFNSYEKETDTESLIKLTSFEELTDKQKY